ncbi:hypothetical protein ANN_22582 [Periplaneta americana]|uniref:Uncharacterized protein n=1 Tax=Periplaneta americana TaxID=6978 RepID=A0ABQ8S8Z4_PERAM|nr:hypothetical protein ANN_22582 [Periplaneta americana]
MFWRKFVMSWCESDVSALGAGEPSEAQLVDLSRTRSDTLEQACQKSDTTCAVMCVDRRSVQTASMKRYSYQFLAGGVYEQVIPKLQTFRYLIHQQCLCSRVLKMNDMLKTECIRSRGLYHRQFTQLLQDVDSEFEWLPYYKEQDGATAHMAENSMRVLRRMFPGHIIFRRGDILWSPSSPDLILCHYFLWSYLMSKVYVNRPQTTDDLKIAIAQEMANIDGEMLERATRNFRERLEECIQRDGHPVGGHNFQHNLNVCQQIGIHSQFLWQ